MKKEKKKFYLRASLEEHIVCRNVSVTKDASVLEAMRVSYERKEKDL